MRAAPLLTGVSLSGILLILASCSAGAGGPAQASESGLRVVATYPAAHEWAVEGADVALVFNRALDPESVRLRSIVVRHRGGGDVGGVTTVDGATLRWQPAEPLAEGWYELEVSPDVRARDGSEWHTLQARRSEFAIRRDAGRWSHPVILGAAGSANPLLAQDPLGGAALAWMLDATVQVAEFDRDQGWLGATPVMTVPANSDPVQLSVARGSSTLAIATAQAQAGLLAPAVVRLRVSRGFDADGKRTFDVPPVTFFEALRQPLQMVVDADGAVVMLLVTAVADRQELRLLRFVGHDLRMRERLGGAADQVAVERVEVSAQGDVAIAWNEITAGVAARFVRVLRQTGLDPVEPLATIGAPRDAGFDGTGNAWTLVPASSTTMRFRTQTARHWAQAGVELPYDLAHLVSFDLDLLALAWRSTGGAGTLSAQRFDRLGRVSAGADLFGPTFEPLVPVTFVGDPDRGVLAVWRAGDSLIHSQLARGADDVLAWSTPRAWYPDHLAVPIERALVTPAGRRRTWFTFVADGRLAATFHEPGRAMPRPMRNDLRSAEDDPLGRAIVAGTAQGYLLLVHRSERGFEGQWLR